MTKLLEKIAFNYLLKRGYQITFPTIYFSSGNDKVYRSATYWEGKNRKTRKP